MTFSTKLIVFDWDGTLQDSTDRIVDSMRASARDVGLTVPNEQAVKDIIGLGLTEALEQLFGSRLEVDYDRIVAAYRHHYLNASTVPAEMFAGAAQMLGRLRDDDYVLAVATGKARRGLDRIFDETGFRDYFATSRCADEAQSKPHPQMLIQIMAEVGVTPQETLMVGDTEHDMKMANACGVGPVAVSFGAQPLTRLRPHNPVTCIESLDQLPLWLTQQQGKY